MNAIYYNFYYPPHEHIEFSTNNLIANVGSLFLKPGRAVFGKKVVVFDKDNIPSVNRTIENPIEHPIFAVALRIILWIPTFLGYLFLELARATSTPFETKMWEARKACVMDILNHNKWGSWEERKVTASKICSLLSNNEMRALAYKLYGEYSTKRDEMVGLQAAFMRYEVMWPQGDFSSWKSSDVDKLERLRFASMSDETVVKWASLSRSLIRIFRYLPPDRHQSILNLLNFDKKIVHLLSDYLNLDNLRDILSDSCKSLVKIVNELFVNHIIHHPLATVINEFKESIGLLIDLSWIFAEEHDSLLKNLLKHIGYDKKNKNWLVILIRSAFDKHNLAKLVPLLTKEQIILFYRSCSGIWLLKKEFFKLILKHQDIRSKLNDSDFKEKIYPDMRNIYSSYPSRDFFPDKESRNQDKYKFLFSPCDEEIESLRNIPCSLLKTYLDAVKKFFIDELSLELFLHKISLSDEDPKHIFQLTPIPPDLQEKIWGLESEIQEIILKKRNEYLEHFYTILYLDKFGLVFHKIYNGILTEEEKNYILTKPSLEKPEEEQPISSSLQTFSLQIGCIKFLHEHLESISMNPGKCSLDLRALINACEPFYKSLCL